MAEKVIGFLKKFQHTERTIGGSLHFDRKNEWEAFKKAFKDYVVEWYISGEDNPKQRELYEVYTFKIEGLKLDAYGVHYPNPKYNPQASLVKCPKCGEIFDESELKQVWIIEPKIRKTKEE